MERKVSIAFEGSVESGDVISWNEYFDDVSSDCTDAQLSAFGSVCGAIVDATLTSFEVTETRNIEVV